MMAVRLTFLVGLGLLGACTAQLLRYRFLPLSEVLRWDTWDVSIGGAIAGTLIGHLLWVIAKPRQRASRGAVLCVVANITVWISFLIFSPPVPTSEFQRIAAERAQRDAVSGGMDLTSDLPIVVAGRWHGTFFPENRVDSLLWFFAAPAIAFADLLVKPARYIGIDATRGESFATAGLGFLFSTAFWAAVGGIMSALGRAFLRGLRRWT